MMWWRRKKRAKEARAARTKYGSRFVYIVIANDKEEKRVRKKNGIYKPFKWDNDDIRQDLCARYWNVHRWRNNDDNNGIFFFSLSVVLFHCKHIKQQQQQRRRLQMLLQHTHRSNAARKGDIHVVVCALSREDYYSEYKKQICSFSICTVCFCAQVFFSLPSLFLLLLFMMKKFHRWYLSLDWGAHSSEALLCLFEFIAIQFNGIPTAFSCNASISKQ